MIAHPGLYHCSITQGTRKSIKIVCTEAMNLLTLQSVKV